MSCLLNVQLAPLVLIVGQVTLSEIEITNLHLRANPEKTATNQNRLTNLIKTAPAANLPLIPPGAERLRIVTTIAQETVQIETANFAIVPISPTGKEQKVEAIDPTENAQIIGVKDPTGIAQTTGAKDRIDSHRVMIAPSESSLKEAQKNGTIAARKSRSATEPTIALGKALRIAQTIAMNAQIDPILVSPMGKEAEAAQTSPTENAQSIGLSINLSMATSPIGKARKTAGKALNLGMEKENQVRQCCLR